MSIRRSKPQRWTRVRPGQLEWPSAASWQEFGRRLHGRLIALASRQGPGSARARARSSDALVKQLRNPFFLGDDPGLTQSSGYLRAWTTQLSAYAVAVADTSDVVRTVNFARDHRLRLVVRGGGHSYLGQSNAPDSLLLWTRSMNHVTFHNDFRGTDRDPATPPIPAVSVGAGATWGEVYRDVTTRHHRYVQGGGCTTVGAVGLIQGGGFGSFSKRYGLASAGLLEAEVVTADGTVRIASPTQHPDLFWAIKGGGGGTFGVVTRVTLRTWELPRRFGAVFGSVRATSEDAFGRLVERLLDHYRERLFNPNWGEQIAFEPGHVAHVRMVFQGLDRGGAESTWRPFREWIGSSPDDYALELPFVIADFPAERFWDVEYLRAELPWAIVLDDRPGASPTNFLWAGDQAEAGQFLHAYHSSWLPQGLLADGSRPLLSAALVRAARLWRVSLHFNKGLAGAPEAQRQEALHTPMNPDVVDAFALLITASHGSPAYPGLGLPEPDIATAERDARRVAQAVAEIRPVAPDAGSYVAETDFFEPEWKRRFWGDHYTRLLEVKRTYDPVGLFFVRHGVGSDEWTADGFERRV
jgi:FAD/FMN-containing dehydrogenase